MFAEMALRNWWIVKPMKCKEIKPWKTAPLQSIWLATSNYHLWECHKRGAKEVTLLRVDGDVNGNQIGIKKKSRMNFLMDSLP